MDEHPVANRDGNERIFQQVISQFGAPAYVRRARRVQDAFDALLASCRRQRDEWLIMVVVRLGRLRGLAETWDRLLPCLADAGQIVILEQLWNEVKPDLQIQLTATTAERKLRRALTELVTDIEAFNRRWSAFLPTVALSGVNELRDGYNRWYVLEKECAVRSAVVARHGFEPLPTLTTQDLVELLPILPIPRMKRL